ncbi:MAG: hypothetical protein HY979_03505 [Candidatus Magasanikbacteria bacterium]|nr:hypothetical protein [Candidatus Magasanikbacteria bacterium]
MYLVIDNSGDNQVLVYAYLNTKWVQAEMDLNKKSLLAALVEYTDSIGQQVPDIKGIAVVVGLGKFTATRVAVTVANALALALSIPVLAVDKFSENLDEQLAVAPKGVYISARYSAPAHIGVKKTK